MLFTERSRHLKVSPRASELPRRKDRGRATPGPEAAAIREAEEEVGMKPGLVTVVGCLEDTCSP